MRELPLFLFLQLTVILDAAILDLILASIVFILPLKGSSRTSQRQRVIGVYFQSDNSHFHAMYMYDLFQECTKLSSNLIQRFSLS